MGEIIRPTVQEWKIKLGLFRVYSHDYTRFYMKSPENTRFYMKSPENTRKNIIIHDYT